MYPNIEESEARSVAPSERYRRPLRADPVARFIAASRTESLQVSANWLIVVGGDLFRELLLARLVQRYRLDLDRRSDPRDSPKLSID